MRVGLFLAGQFAGTTCQVLEEEQDKILIKNPNYWRSSGMFQILKPNEVIAVDSIEEADRVWKIIQKANSVEEGLALWKK